ncbi:mechanosensitive ion channel [Pricia sp. S334]|uniref:Mechanosensitive ion channel n=1 Tax=Pricia mediterranea TaxID=3076079 RepID=A0ABU3L7F1_9FLAO|nr:mechanosensitive ion channel domain-containing protein [Pricia sp. S334]MDT7829288.1 mechanosensitive ion channel [Pricia sp. S334]
MNEIEQLLQHLRGQLMELLPGIIISFLILAIGYGIARLIKYLTSVLFNYMGKLAGPRAGSLNLGQAGSFLGSAFFWLILFSTLLLITNYLGMTVITGWFQGVMQHVPNILAAILIIFASIMLGNLVSDLLTSFGKRTGFHYSQALIRIVRFILIALAVVIALDQVGIEISILKDVIVIILAALLFGAALAFGLGAQTSISNILSSFYVRKMYSVGDQIRIGKTSGKILSINTNSVILENGKGQVTIPTKEFNESKSYLIKTD